MTQQFDIFNPQISSVAKGLEGKSILIYGDNAVGKTKQATQMPKPFYFGFEKGIRAIAGIPFLPINKWTDFKKINKQLTDPKNSEKAKEMYQTLIFDTVYVASIYCQDYLCRKHGVETIGEGNDGYGLWKEYETEFWTELDKLLGSGFTLAFIGHSEADKNGFIYPKGDKRSMKPVIDNSDIVVYVQSNGVDENNRVIPSSGFTVKTDAFFARSRFDYMQPVIAEFTAKNLEKAIADAITRQEEAEGITAVSYEEQKESYQSEALDFEQLKAQINSYGGALVNANLAEEAADLLKKHIGESKKVSETKPYQADILSLLLDELKELAEANGVTVE